jgi:thiamine biosynthesis lipoprotein ApbE
MTLRLCLHPRRNQPRWCQVAHSVPGANASGSWTALGTSVVLRLTDPTGVAAARTAVELELNAIDRVCSRFRSDSELSRLNAQSGRATRVSRLLIEALELSLRAAQLTGGDLDPTIGSALELSGYDRDWSLLAPAIGEPAPVVTVNAHVRCGWRTISLDRASLAVRVPAGVKLDLGATAKAWAADRAAAAAASASGCGALVSIGGDIATSGRAPAGGWLIRVTDDHRSDCSASGQTLAIHGGGLATSSTTVRRWSHEQHTMHHIIDPRTGAPVHSSWRTVSVAAANCTDANIAATAAVIRTGAAPRWLADIGLPARLVDQAGRVMIVGGWPQGGSA